MIPKEILQQIHAIEIRSGKLVNEIFAGQYSSVFKGRGMEFAEVREYLPGDDIRSIDWNVTARHGKPFVKKHTEERELTVIFLVDASASQRFGTAARFKAEVAAEIASVLAFSALKNNDRVGLLLFTDRIEKLIRPKKGKNHVLRIIRETLYHRADGTGTDIAAALRYLNDIWRRKAVVFLISDFQAVNYEQALKVAGKRHDLIAISVSDPRESMLPKVGLVEVQDAESGAYATIDTSDAATVAAYARRKDAQRAELKRLFAAANIDHIAVTTAEPYTSALIRFFKARERRLAH